MYLSTSTSTRAFSEMYLSTFRVLYKLYLSTDILKYNVLLPGSDSDQLICFSTYDGCVECGRHYGRWRTCDFMLWIAHFTRRWPVVV